ncbi:transporter suffix domain-containing protein [Maridesulfovibrio ferrireducens]|uniref:transporter suffix domain-containing protein n=1 Tax=Maridesulfovibrio ferrireducens TaxID=246191 RepID=UPI001A2E09D2|nr:transporter suffix domain-containing protein [Maridesulfovibrio ferrireducens]MBI9111927.1 transporter suffix domain-containing protein [Maridesulfovibrio ferrireducens]
MNKDWKYYLGIILISYSFLPFFVFAMLPFIDVDIAKSGTFAVIFLATGEVAFLGAAALLGKEFILLMKTRFMSIFKRTPSLKHISRIRHRIGVGLMIASLLPYYYVLFSEIFFLPLDHGILTGALILSELLFMTSMVTLGSQFWDRLKHLFDWPGAE